MLRITGKGVKERIVPVIDAARDGQVYLLIDPATGNPYSGDLFRKRWSKVRKAAAETCPTLTARGNALQFRDLRRTFGVWARMAGASKDDIADVLGNSAGQDPTLAGVYMPPSFYTALRAVDAVQRPEKDEKPRLA